MIDMTIYKRMPPPEAGKSDSRFVDELGAKMMTRDDPPEGDFLHPPEVPIATIYRPCWIG
jgi:hypothetical protein